MEDPSRIEQDKQRAEVFDALGHPTRILILKVLSEGSLGFADLKKKTAIESSGHLQHHLTKLNGLIKTDEYGKYCLSDDGKDALLTVQTVENASSKKEVKGKGHRRFRVASKSVVFLLVALLITSSAIAAYEYNQASILRDRFAKGGDVMAYYTEFGVPPTTNTNSSHNPPISMYKALQLTLELYGYNETSVSRKNIDARLEMWQTTTNGTLISQNPLTSIPSDYSPVTENGIIYRYVWVITISDAANFGSQIGLIDASTGNFASIRFHNFIF
jgi:DNA-binding HxlR family transcriptional regulator